MKNKGKILKENAIRDRRYFYPLISEFPSYRGLEPTKSDNLPNAKKLAYDVICLPIYANLDKTLFSPLQNK